MARKKNQMKYEFSDELKSEIDILMKRMPTTTESNVERFLGMVEIVTKVAYFDGYQAGMQWAKKQYYGQKTNKET